MDAVKLLKDDHKKVKDLFRQFEKARSADRKKTIYDQDILGLIQVEKAATATA